MSLRRLLLTAAFLLLGLTGALAAADAAPERRGRPELVGTYHRVAKDLVQPDGTLRDVYEDLLVTGTRSYRLKLPPTAHLRGGEPIRVRGTLAANGRDVTVDTVEPLGAPSPVTTTGTTKVLVILAYWTAPDSVTVAQAKSRLLDDNGWFGEASYGQLGLTGDVTGWHKITGPTGGQCYANHHEIMTRAQAKAAVAGYDAADYGRTIVYFPQCGGDASGAAGWAYQPGDTVWLNGYLDRRVSVHEQGHNYGLAHAHTYTCTSGGTQVTLGGTCSYSEYGDEYDAMGSSDYAAHFSAPQKDQLGWLAGKKRTLTSAPTTFTLPPFEKYGSTPLAAVTGTTVATRKYWIEYRQALGYDSTLPSGATGGVLVHLKDSAISAGGGPFLLDMSPQNTFSNAVIPPGGAWTSPEGVRISVGTVSASGAVVTVTGGAAPPVAPTVPLDVAATGGDETVKVTWKPPASNGGATVQNYVVKRTPGNETQTVEGLTTTFENLTNGTTYSFTVAAKNSAGTGPASTAVTAIPAAQLPSVAVTAPAPGTVTGTVTLAATATPHPVGQAPIDFVSFEVDGSSVDVDFTAPYSVEWDSSWAEDGPHVVTATAYDTSFRYATSAPVNVTLVIPKPQVTITSPVNGTTTSADSVTLQSTTTPVDESAPVEFVLYELADGTGLGYATVAPYEATWDTTLLNGTYEVVAKAYDSTGRVGRSAPVSVTFDHPVPSVALTAPADGASVQGSAVVVSATATPNGSPVERVEFYLDTNEYIGADYDAPYAVDWDTGSLSGQHALTAVAYDTSGRNATSAARTVTVTNPVPSVALTSPADFAVVSGLATLTATATPNATSGSPIQRVVFVVDGWQQVADVAAPGPYTTTWDPAGSYGQHTVVATAYDEAGRSATSPTVTFTVPAPVPSAVITNPTDGATVAAGQRTLRVAAAANPQSQAAPYYAEFYVDGEWAGWSQTFTNGGFEVPWFAERGTHVITAEVTDEQFRTGTAAAVSVTVAGPATAPLNVTATPGADGTATVAFDAPEDDGGSAVTGYRLYVNTSAGDGQAVGASPAQVTGLPNGQSATFYVRAVTTAGPGALSTASNTVVPGTKVALSNTASPTTIGYGASTTVKGRLTVFGTTTPIAGRTVWLMRCTVGTLTCAQVKSAVTNGTGDVSIAYALPATRDLRLRYVNASGADTYIPLTSAARKVSVRAVVSSAITKTSMTLGSTATVYGRVKPVHSGKRVYLQRLTSTGWKSVTYKNQTSTGYVSFAVKPTTRGTWYYRLYFPADSDHLAGTSASRSVRVT